MKRATGTVRILQRGITAAVLMTLIPAAAVAQYPGGGSAPSYGSKGAVIGGVAAGVAVGAGLIHWKSRSHAKVQGCVAGDGDKLVAEKGKQTYNLSNKQNQSLKPGERVELLGKKSKNSAGEPVFEVRKMSKDLGQCTTAETAEMRTQN
jgi:hypothetical protein